MNVSLLENDDYCNGVMQLINKIQSDSALLQSSYSVKWDVMKKRVKEFSIRKGKEYANARRNELKQLEDEVHRIDNKSDVTDADALKRSESQNRIEEIYNNFSKCAQVRARVDDVNESQVISYLSQLRILGNQQM